MANEQDESRLDSNTMDKGNLNVRELLTARAAA